ncbi:MAG: RNA polymerase sporulation sigma factor SigH [Nocardioidaceae bacterium]
MRDDATDEELVAGVRAGHEASVDVLLLRYRGFARARARSYFLVGADREDVVQEAMIGLCNAIRDFDADAGASFRTFADLCIARQLITAVKTANRHKHGPLNNYVSLHRPVVVDGEGERTLGEVLPAPAHADPAEQVVCAERVLDLQRHVDRELSDLEAEVLQLHVDGRSYPEISATLKRHTKSVDNALQRVRRKLGSHLSARDAEFA